MSDSLLDVWWLVESFTSDKAWTPGDCVWTEERRREGEAKGVSGPAARREITAILRGYGVEEPVKRDCRLCGNPNHGKPYVDVEMFDFSASHTENLSAVALLRGPGRVGIDVELAARDVTMQTIRSCLGTIADCLGATEPVSAWCRMEAIGKAAGTGLIDAPSVRVSGARTEGWDVGEDLTGRSWVLSDISLRQYRGCVAIVGTIGRVSRRDYAWPAGQRLG